MSDGGMPEEAVSAAVSVVCGRDRASAGRYEIRNDALRSIARRRDLAEADTAALTAYVASRKGALHPAREAALRNDVLNLRGDRRDAVADTVAVWTLGLLGDASDVGLINSVADRGGSRLSGPCASAIGRIEGRVKE